MIIQCEPDLSIEPGHQVLVLPYDRKGTALAELLSGNESFWHFIDEDKIRIPHDANVDAQIIALINALADVRYQAPHLVQLTMVESTSPVMRILTEDSGS